MKSSKSQTHRKYHCLPDIKAESKRRLTAYGGLVIFIALFQSMDFANRLRKCFAHLKGQKIFGFGKTMLLLVVHRLIGLKHLRDLDICRHDPLVARAIGVLRLPDVSTVSRALKDVDDRAVEKVRGLSRDIVLERLAKEKKLARITLDFDGSVQSTKGHAEGTAVGFNKTSKGSRSYYPLFCTLAETAQFLDLLHRPGNVHDSKGAREFMLSCFAAVRRHVPNAELGTRIDSAFFSEVLLDTLDCESVGFTCSVPFNRYPEFKRTIEGLDDQGRWLRINDDVSQAEMIWKPKRWAEGKGFRFIAVRNRRLKQTKGPLQLDLFMPRDHEYEYKVIVTNRSQEACEILAFHNGRGSQEALFAEGKQFAGIGAVGTKRKLGNQLLTLAGLLAHNLAREVQMRATEPTRGTLPKRPARWVFMHLGTLQKRIVSCVGSLTQPQGRLQLMLGASEAVVAKITALVEAAGSPERQAA